MSRERKSDELLFMKLLYKKPTRDNNVSLTVNSVFVLPLLERKLFLGRFWGNPKNTQKRGKMGSPY